MSHRSLQPLQHVRSHEQGYILISVITMLGLIAAAGYLITVKGTMAAGAVSRNLEADTARGAAEAGFGHVYWLLGQNTSCSNFVGVAGTLPKGDSYTVSVTPAVGSPITIESIGVASSGARSTLRRMSVKTHQAPQSVVLQPGATGIDTYIWDGANKENNFGATQYMELNNASAERVILIRFDFAVVPAGSKITSAILELYLEGGNDLSNGVIDVHRVTRSWFEGEEDGDEPSTPGATYEKYDGTSMFGRWTNPGGDYDPDPVSTTVIPTLTQGWYQWDVTALAQGGPQSDLTNNGALLRASAGDVDKIKFTSSDGNAAERPKLTVGYACECGPTCVPPQPPPIIILSTDSDATLGGLGFTDIDLAEYDVATDTASLYLDGGLTTLDKDIDALHVLANGHLVLSTRNTSELGGVTLEAGDLIDYDPVADSAVLIFDGSVLFGDSSREVNSVHVLDNGHLILSTDNDATLGSLSFTDIDLVEYDLFTDTASLFFDGSSTTLGQDIASLHVLTNGHLVLGTKNTATLGGVTIEPGDLIDYDPVADSAALIFDGSALFSNSSQKINSVYVGAGSGSVGIPLLFVVADLDNPNLLEDGRKSLFEAWGYNVNLIDDGDSAATFAEAVGVNIVVYVSGSISAGILAGKLEDAAIGIVNEAGLMIDNFGLAGGSSSVTDVDLDNVMPDHYIMSNFVSNPVSIFNVSMTMIVLGSTPAPDLMTLAEPAGGGPNPSVVAALNTGATRFDGESSAGRRVHLPVAAANASQLTESGRILVRRAIEWAGGAVDFVVFDPPVITPPDFECVATFRDRFNAISYSNNDGNRDWSTAWIEVGEDNGPTSGDERVLNDGAIDDPSDYALRVQDNDNGGEGVRRALDLSGFSTAVLGFDYRRESLDNSSDYVTLSVSSDGGNQWQELQRFEGATNDTSYLSTSQDISDYIGSDTVIRLLSSPTLGRNDRVYFDDIEVCAK